MPGNICNASLRIMIAPKPPKSCHQHKVPQIQQSRNKEGRKKGRRKWGWKERERERRNGQRETRASKPIGKQQLKVTDSELEQIVKNKEKKIKKRAEIKRRDLVKHESCSVYSKAARYDSGSFSISRLISSRVIFSHSSHDTTFISATVVTRSKALRR